MHFPTASKHFFQNQIIFRSVGILPFFLVSTVQLEHIFRSISFILLVYGAIETILSYRDNRNKGAVSVALGLGLLAFGEFLGWYSFVFPESILYSISMTIKIAGLVALFIPVSKVPLKKIKFDDDLDKI